MSITIELGERLPELLVNVRRRSSQGWVLTVTDRGTGKPLTIEGAVLIEVDDEPRWVGAVDGGTVTWRLDATDTDLPLGRHGAALVRTYGDGGRDVWARGVVIVR